MKRRIIGFVFLSFGVYKGVSAEAARIYFFQLCTNIGFEDPRLVSRMTVAIITFVETSLGFGLCFYPHDAMTGFLLRFVLIGLLTGNLFVLVTGMEPEVSCGCGLLMDGPFSRIGLLFVLILCSATSKPRALER